MPEDRRREESDERRMDEERGMGGVMLGGKEPGKDSLASMDASAEVSERDLKEGERRRGGQAH